MQEPFGTTTGLPIHDVNEFHPRRDDAARAGDLAHLETHSVIAGVIPRRLIAALTSALAEGPVVARRRPHQVGKATLALELANTQPAVYPDLAPSGN